MATLLPSCPHGNKTSPYTLAKYLRLQFCPLSFLFSPCIALKSSAPSSWWLLRGNIVPPKTPLLQAYQAQSSQDKCSSPKHPILYVCSSLSMSVLHWEDQICTCDLMLSVQPRVLSTFTSSKMCGHWLSLLSIWVLHFFPAELLLSSHFWLICWCVNSPVLPRFHYQFMLNSPFSMHLAMSVNSLSQTTGQLPTLILVSSFSWRWAMYFYAVLCHNDWIFWFKTLFQNFGVSATVSSLPAYLKYLMTRLLFIWGLCLI